MVDGASPAATPWWSGVCAWGGLSPGMSGADGERVVAAVRCILRAA